MPHDSPFQLEAPFLPAGDQPQAVAELVRGSKRATPPHPLRG